MANRIDRLQPREQDPAVRAHNFEEVCYGFTPEEAKLEATRCLHCKNPRCVPSCPVGIDIPGFIARVKDGDFGGAMDAISRDSTLPAICGRVCPQETQCEGSCILGVRGKSVAIGHLERFVADWAREHPDDNNAPGQERAAEEQDTESASTAAGHETGKTAEAGAGGQSDSGASKQKVAVIGSGPSGLACAGDLAKKGYKVTIYEALHKAGGVLVYGIPEFRLPKDTVVRHEVDAIRSLGVDIQTDVVIGKTITIDSMLGDMGYDAVYIASGAGLPRFMGIPGENLNGVYSANEFLTRNNLMKAFLPEALTPIKAGRKAVVVGGGNVAMDAARTALRLGADVTIVYRRTEVELPARKEEVRHAMQEGIHFQMLTNPVEILGDEAGKVNAVRCIRMELGEPDESGRRSPVPIPESEFEIATDTVIMALGTSPNPMIARSTSGLETNRRGCLSADQEGRTTRKGIFAGGDAVSGAATVILAMGAGRKAAASIDAYLTGLRQEQ